MIRTVINGVNGKMGQIVAQMILKHQQFDVVCGVDHSPQKVAHTFPVYRNPFEYQGEVDLIIDFSHPSYLKPLLAFAKDKRAALVIGTTGYSDEELGLIRSSALEIPILLSANMSIGINIFNQILRSYTRLLGSLFDIEIIEKHHNQKLDAPSGTAYLLADTINRALDYQKTFVYGRHGNRQRQANQIGIHAIRGGTQIGEHSVLFAGQDEVITITHQAHSREVYGHGALVAGLTIVNKPAGLYTLDDVLDMKGGLT